ncbi:asparagine synthase (glutamine-hydrolyzing) [Singulisphaera acidiphila]|uniref:asparagine synthase (glutamine-hydrolyzing) n=1 Tax=Singulisphaera acidiphila (strain ATCC BAA-1392 / DSM 18658 / VKM B-2454 / MOB10) TaxID=886293 RepID=L0DE87_SINAD|nr:asparagine synthase (glutamine-hydrolyzing) [Singulisphaera acidiphila]AGA26961.1 asparagine synthase, glutamine-hydrolyzing [Singulisphaera acidiphila DSM 18658]
MCGIAGFVNRDNKPVDPAVLARMTTTLAHRGPDGEGFLVEGPVALGHRRLSIIDLAGGSQPMANEDESVWVTYNGEIYNEPELRKSLQARGHIFRSQSDTECLVHLYEEHGADFAQFLNGMFALALWDKKRNRLVLARDRMGQKPLIYAQTASGGLVFGSEAKALLEHPEISRRLDLPGLARYLFYEYIPAPYSIWSGLRKLPPAHVLVWEGGEARVSRYWTAPASLEESESPPFDVAADQFWTDFRSAVARHRRSDVPLGVFLSGGIDSSSVAAALAELEPAQGIHTFSIGFADPSFDESAHARLVARHLGTNHHERTFAVEAVQELLPDVAGWLDEPFGDASILPTHLLSRFARSEVTVALGGDGADELLAGYPTFVAERAADLFRRLPRAARALAGAAVGRLPVNHGNISLDFRLKQFLRGAAESAPLAHQRWLGSYSGEEIQRLLIAGETIDVEAEHLLRASGLVPSADPLTRSLALYQDTYLPDDILAKVDRASMACGLEVRAPFLDALLVDSMQTLPPRFKYGRNQTKRLLKKAASGRLPATILERPKKGFGIPVAHWLRGPLAGLLGSLLNRSRLERQGLFNPREVERRISEHAAGVRDHRKPLWTLLMFQLWYDRWHGS